MPFDTQTRLLRVLADNEFYRVGGASPVRVDVRIIAATHQNLEEVCSRGLIPRRSVPSTQRYPYSTSSLKGSSRGCTKPSRALSCSRCAWINTETKHLGDDAKASAVGLQLAG